MALVKTEKTSKNLNLDVNQQWTKKCSCVCISLRTITVDWLRFYDPLNTKSVISNTFLKPIAWLGMEKQNLTQQKHAYINQK